MTWFPLSRLLKNGLRRGSALKSGRTSTAAATRKRQRSYKPGLEALEARLAPTAGVLDPTLGSGGKVVTHFANASYASAIAYQADGKIVVAGQTNSDFLVARYNADGSPDTTFGAGTG